jgi:hypothetical protein
MKHIGNIDCAQALPFNVQAFHSINIIETFHI